MEIFLFCCLSFAILLNGIAVRKIIKRLVYLELAEREIKEHIRVIYEEVYRGKK